MRKDKGLNGDLDRLPMLTWIMLLKFLDDLEIQREGEAKLAGKKFKPAVEPPYRWRDWAAMSDGITGDELLAFINNEETTLPNGKKGDGLFRYLRTLTSSNGDNRRDVIATVFKGVQNPDGHRVSSTGPSKENCERCRNVSVTSAWTTPARKHPPPSGRRCHFGRNGRIKTGRKWQRRPASVPLASAAGRRCHTWGAHA
jgi:hypothetical protein